MKPIRRYVRLVAGSESDHRRGTIAVDEVILRFITDYVDPIPSRADPEYYIRGSDVEILGEVERETRPISPSEMELYLLTTNLSSPIRDVGGPGLA